MKGIQDDRSAIDAEWEELISRGKRDRESVDAVERVVSPQTTTCARYLSASSETALYHTPTSRPPYPHVYLIEPEAIFLLPASVSLPLIPALQLDSTSFDLHDKKLEPSQQL